MATATVKTSVVNTPAGGAVTETKVLSVDEQKGMLGDEKEVPLGGEGFVGLDEKGKPTGPVVARKTPGKPEAAVHKIGPRIYDELTTPSGAPLTTNMQPNPDHYDEGLLKRNPVDAALQKAVDEASKQPAPVPATAA